MAGLFLSTYLQTSEWHILTSDAHYDINDAAYRITTGGILGSICHGSGFSHMTVNDYIRTIEYVDANGVLQTITNPEELHIAAGSFGLLGIVTHVTYEVKRITFAVMQPRKVKTMLAVPPLELDQAPEVLRPELSNEQLQDSIAEFERRAEHDHYAEWSWFSYQSDVLVNTWSTVCDATGAVEYTTPSQTFVQ